MSKLWEGRFSKNVDELANNFNSSIAIDKRMWREDIAGSVAHVAMLGKCKIISGENSKKIIETLKLIECDILAGKLLIEDTAEDIHTFIEGELTLRIGELGKMLHTARSRNDQTVLDFKLNIFANFGNLKNKLLELIKALINGATANKTTIMPGYTHLQRAQPISFAQHILAYANMFRRDITRLDDFYKRANFCPLGSCALNGTTYPIDRHLVAESLGFSAPMQNSIDGVSDRDFALELLSTLSIIMVHLSRFCEEIILWSSWEFKFVEVDDGFSTGSSIMPQKKNPDIAELIRGKSGRVFGDLMALFTVLKGLPLAYNKDMQEDKELVFDALDTVQNCIEVFIPMFNTLKINVENMENAGLKGFINATDCADYLTKKGMAFRDAYKITARIVAFCIENNKTLETLSLIDYNAFSELFSEDIFIAINLKNIMNLRTSYGGTAIDSVIKQIDELTKFLGEKGNETFS